MAWTFDDFDLSEWKVTLPNDADYYVEDGGDGDFSDDTAYEVKDIEGFEDPDAFYYNEEEGTMVFSADVSGAKTSSSTKYTRSELRERTVDEDGNTSDAAWTIEDGGTLSATLKVTELAVEDDGDAGRVIVGQIHGEDDELVRIYYNADGELYYANEITGSDGEERLFSFENEAGESPDVALGETFSYIIDVTDGQLIVQIYADGEVYSPVPTDGVDPYEIVDTWYDDTFYFKAGVYQAVNDLEGDAAEGTGTAMAEFYGIDVSHEPGEGRDAWLGETDSTTDGDTGTDTDTDIDTIEGTSSADDITGTDGDDVIDGLGSADTIDGGAGNDTVYGGGGADELRGDAGDDVLQGDGGNDVVKGGDGDDEIHGGTGSDELWGNDGDDTIHAGEGGDWIKGGAGADTYVFITVDGIDMIADFSKSDGDSIDLSAVLDGATGLTGDVVADGFVQFEQDGDDTLVYVDLDGSDGSGSGECPIFCV